MAVFQSVELVVGGDGAVRVGHIVRVGSHAAVAVDHVVADHKAVALVDVVRQHPGRRAGQIRLVAGGRADDNGIIDVVTLGVGQIAA